MSRGYRVARVEQVESKEEAQERNRRDGSGTTVQREVHPDPCCEFLQ